MTEIKRKPTLCVDFDGVIHSYRSGWQGETVIADPPVEGALRWLWEMAQCFDVQIYSSRSRNPEALTAMQTWLIEYALREFSEGHPMTAPPYPIKFAHEKPAAFLTIDDRAICFDGDFGKLEARKLLNFTPWNKKP